MSLPRTKQGLIDAFNASMKIVVTERDSKSIEFNSIRLRIENLKQANSFNEALIKMTTGAEQEKFIGKRSALNHYLDAAQQMMSEHYPLGQAKAPETQPSPAELAANRKTAEALYQVDDAARKEYVKERAAAQSEKDRQRFFPGDSPAVQVANHPPQRQPSVSPPINNNQYARNKEFGQRMESTFNKIGIIIESIKSMPPSQQAIVQNTLNNLMGKITVSKLNTLTDKDRSSISKDQLENACKFDKDATGLHKLVVALSDQAILKKNDKPEMNIEAPKMKK